MCLRVNKNMTAANTYVGTFDDKNWYQVTLNGLPFDPKPSLKIRNHSPDGFAWGYGGSGPSQLALGILLEEFGSEIAQEHYMAFKFEVIAGLPKDGFTLTSEQVKAWLEKHKYA